MGAWKTLAGAVLTLAISACATLPAPDAALEDARAAVAAVQNDPQVASLAPVELGRAVDTLHRADALWLQHGYIGAVHHLAYLARTRAAIAAETARLKNAEASVATANAERDRVRLEARANETERARREAAQAQREAEHARGQAEATRREVLAAQERAASAEREVEAARRQADSAQAQARSLQAELAQLHAKPSDRGMVVTLGDLLFDTGRAELAPGGARAVDRLADFMREYPQRRVSIEGYTDSIGSAEANQELSERRAAAVRRALVDRGVDPSRILTRGYGEEFPVASNVSAAGRQMNRRVEIVISDENGKIAPHAVAPPATSPGAAPG